MAVRIIKSADHLYTINLENHKNILKICIKLNELFENDTILDSQNDKFLAGVHPLYQRFFKYCMEKLNR